MNRKQPITKICQVCGREFEDYSPRAKYCPECRTTAYRKKHKEYLTGYTPAPKEPESPKRTLDEKLEECHAAGKSYADAQRAETIEAFARVMAPEPSEPREAIEPQEVPDAPEVPAESEANMSMDPATKKALIRAQAKLEVLVEFFRAEGSDTIEFPGRVISEVVAALSEAVEEPEDERDY